MSFFDTLKGLGKSLQDEVKKFSNQTFLEGVLAGAALVAYADGNVSSDEKQKLIRFVQTNDALSVFESDKVIKTFTKFIERMDFDTVIGTGECLKTISKLKGKDEARLMIRVCCAIGAADGNFDDDEKAIVRKICNELSIDPKEFDL